MKFFGNLIKKITETNFKTMLKALSVITLGFAIVIFFVAFVYLKLIPYAVSNEKVINFAEKLVENYIDADLKIQNPELITMLRPVAIFKVQKITLTKSDKTLLDLEDLDLIISFKDILKKHIELKKFNTDKLYLDVNELISAIPATSNNASKSSFDWTVGWLDSLLSLKEVIVLYDFKQNTNIKVVASNISVSNAREPKALRFDIKADIKKSDNLVKFQIHDNNNVFIKDHKLVIDKALLNINNSKVYIDAVADEKNNFDLSLYSNKFDLVNVIKILKTDVIIPEAEELLSFFKNIKGDFNFLIRLNNHGIDGDITVNNSSLKVIPLADLPVFVNQGKIKINNQSILLKDFDCGYGTDKRNIAVLEGRIDDYTNSVDTYIEVNAKATNDLTKNYLSKIIGSNLTLTGVSGAKAIIKSKYNKIDLSAMFKIAKGDDILVEGLSLSPVDYDRAVKADFYLDGNLLDIKSIKYYIAKELTKESKNIQPILTVDGKMDIATLKVHNIGFDIPKPLPSEFLNVLIGQKVFRKGQIAGNMDVIFKNDIPKLKGTLTMSGVRIPSQRMSVKNCVLTADKNLIKIDVNGRFKRSQYEFKGRLANELVFPIVVKDINLTIDNIDIEKVLVSMSKQTPAVTSQPVDIESFVDSGAEESDDTYVFDTNLLVIEKCVLNVIKGVYKDINFGNLLANLTLNRDGILEISSNRFDFAEGISTLKVFCDLVKQQYNIRLGVKDINADLLASTILNLPKEITGKAKGLVELHTDNSLKLNGKIKFEMENGTIQKVGLVQYALNFAALFRNPLAMLSPSLILDAVNIPDGKFDKINGDLLLKNNIVERMVIKSSAPQLSAFIVGRYNLETNDASMRIYTKFSSKNIGFAGFLRNISLNRLANKISFGSNNDANYYELELAQIPKLEYEDDSQIFLTKVEGDVVNFNFLSSLQKIK